MGTLRSIYPPRRTYDQSFPGWILWAVLCVVFGGSLAGAQRIVSGGAASGSLSLFPADVAFDRAGNLYFSETNRHRVQRIDTAGVMTTVAGSGVQGFAGDGGPAVAAELDSPAGLAVDAGGTLYVADAHNHRVRRVDAVTGRIATVAGTGVAGFSGDGGAAVGGRLNLPMALAVDGAGNLYVADTNNHRVREVVAATGLIVTVAGNGLQGFSGDGGAATGAGIDSPGGVAVDGAGNLFLADTHNQRLRVVKGGVISTVAGMGAGTALALPHGVAVDAVGNVYVADTNNHRVRRIAVDGTITTVAGDGVEAFRGDGGPAVAASLDGPRGVAVSPAGLVTMADSANGRVRQVEADRTIVTLGVGAGVPVVPVSLRVNVPGAVVYGGGTVTATLTGGTAATGSIAFYESTASGTALLGSAGLNGGAAVFGMGAVGAGTHQVYASYAGDESFGAAMSAVVNVAVMPAPVTANVGAVSLAYGQGVPALRGTLAGVLARDASAVSLRLSSGAGVLSPVGSYPVMASLDGAAAGNYALAPVAAAVMITKAASVASLMDGAASVASGAAVTLKVHIASSTSGVPTGKVTLMDGANALAVVALSSLGDAVYVSTGLAPGTHPLVAVYPGDGNFDASTTAVQTLAVASPVVVDFTIATTGAASVTVPAGTSANFNFAVQMEGGVLASPITLTAGGLPLGTTASFNPGTVVPGGANAFQLTVQTAKPAAKTGALRVGAGATLAVLLLPWLSWGRKRAAGLAVLCLGSLLTLMGCGATIIAVPLAAKSYPITVSATATNPAGAVLQHTATVMLTVQ